MRSPKLIILMILLIGIAALFAYLFFSNFEKYTRETETGMSGEALTNPLLAAQRFFAANDIEAKSIEGLTQLPPDHATMIIPTERTEMTRDGAARYLDWVKQGGHLIVAASRGYYREDFSDELLQQAGIKVSEIKRQNDYTDVVEPENPDENNTDENYAGDLILNRDNTVAVNWPGIVTLMDVKMDHYARLDSAATTYKIMLNLEDELGSYLVRLKIEKGYLTVVYNADFMFNSEIGKYDHAAYLWYVSRVDKQRPVWLVFHDSMPSLGVWLLRHAWAPLVSFLMFIALWLWFGSRRFGPVLPPVALARRRLLEHIEATGQFLWKRGHMQKLYRGAHHSMMRTLELRHPSWISLPAQKLHEQLATLSGSSIDEVKRALTAPVTRNEHEFTKTIQILEHIRKSL